MKEKIVCVEWEDASSNSGYYNKNNPQEFSPFPTKTVGHLIKRDKKAVVVSQDRFYKDGKIDGDRHISTIPKKMIKRIVVLGEINETQRV